MFTTCFPISLKQVYKSRTGGPMLKAPNRTQRSKGFKVKHFIQACLLLAVCVWLVNQVKHYYEKRMVSGDVAGTIPVTVITQREGVKLGRKDLDPNVQASSFEIKSNTQKEDDSSIIIGSTEEAEHELETKEGRGGGDDEIEIDGHDQEKTEDDDEPEEVEDLIDEEDREKEDEGEGEGEEIDSDEKGHENDEDDHAQYESRRKSRKAREENYKADDASSAVYATEKLFELKDRETDPIIDSTSKVAENKKSKSERNARLLLMENLGFVNAKRVLSKRNEDINVTSRTRQPLSSQLRTVENKTLNINDYVVSKTKRIAVSTGGPSVTVKEVGYVFRSKHVI